MISNFVSRHINVCLRNCILFCVAEKTNDHNVKAFIELLNTTVLVIQNQCCVLHLHFSSKMRSRVTSLI